MRRLLLSTLLTLWSLSLSALEWTNGTTQSEVAAFDATEIRASFPFTNDTKQTLHVLDIKTDCSCTAGDLAQREFAPEASGSIDLTFHIGSRFGHIVRRTTITYQIGTQPPREEKLVLQVDIPKAINSDRTTLTFIGTAGNTDGNSDGNVEWEAQDLELRMGDDPNLRILGIDTSGVRHFDVTLLNDRHEPFNPDTDQLPGFLRARPITNVERVVENVFVLTDHPQQRYQRVRFNLFQRVSGL